MFFGCLNFLIRALIICSITLYSLNYINVSVHEYIIINNLIPDDINGQIIVSSLYNSLPLLIIPLCYFSDKLLCLGFIPISYLIFSHLVKFPDPILILLDIYVNIYINLQLLYYPKLTKWNVTQTIFWLVYPLNYYFFEDKINVNMIQFTVRNGGEIHMNILSQHHIIIFKLLMIFNFIFMLHIIIKYISKPLQDKEIKNGFIENDFIENVFIENETKSKSLKRIPKDKIFALRINLLFDDNDISDGFTTSALRRYYKLISISKILHNRYHTIKIIVNGTELIMIFDRSLNNNIFRGKLQKFINNICDTITDEMSKIQLKSETYDTILNDCEFTFDIHKAQFENTHELDEYKSWRIYKQEEYFMENDDDLDDIENNYEISVIEWNDFNKIHVKKMIY